MVTARPSSIQAGTGIAWLYARWVCPEMIASMFSSAPLTIRPMSDAGSVASASAVVAAPSCTSSTTMSAPASLSLSASRFAASTGAWIVRPWMPPGETSSSRWSVTAPMKPTLTSPKFCTQLSGRAAEPSSVCRTLAPRYSHSAPPSGLLAALYGAITRFDEIVVTLVELVVTHRRHLKAGRIQRIDRRLVLAR